MRDECFDTSVWWRYWRRGLVAAWLLRFVPYVRMVGLNGSMVTGRIRKESDIDMYVAVAEGHIFTCRILTTLLIHLMGIRRHGRHIAGRICMNRYASTEHMRITPENTYHARVFHNLVPLFSARCSYARYVRDNEWMGIYGYPMRFHEPVITDTLVSKAVRGLGEALLFPIAPAIEARCKTWQKGRYDSDKRVLEKGSRVVLSDYELCFHLAKEHGS